MHYGLLFVLLIALGVALAVNHIVLIACSTRGFYPRDFWFIAWCTAYPVTIIICVALGMASLSLLDNFNNSLANLAALAAIIMLPALCTGAIGAWVWRPFWPAIVMASLSPLIAWLVSRSDSPAWIITAGAVWNVGYASACLPAVLRNRTRTQRGAHGECILCGYPNEGIDSNKQCPECGRGYEHSLGASS